MCVVGVIEVPLVPPRYPGFSYFFSFEPRILPCSCGLPALPSLIREREGFAPAILADLAVDHLAGCRCLEQRAHSATVNAVRRVLIFSLLPRHFFRCGGLRNAQQKPCRGSAGNRAYDLSPRPVYRFFNHAGFLPLQQLLSNFVADRRIRRTCPAERLGAP